MESPLALARLYTYSISILSQVLKQYWTVDLVGFMKSSNTNDMRKRRCMGGLEKTDKGAAPSYGSCYLFSLFSTQFFYFSLNRGHKAWASILTKHKNFPYLVSNPCTVRRLFAPCDTDTAPCVGYESRANQSKESLSYTTDIASGIFQHQLLKSWYLSYQTDFQSEFILHTDTISDIYIYIYIFL